MGFDEYIDDAVEDAKKSQKQNKAERLGLDSSDSLENLEELNKRVDTISELMVATDSRMEKLEDEMSTIRALMRELIAEYAELNREEEQEDNDEPGSTWSP